MDGIQNLSTSAASVSVSTSLISGEFLGTVVGGLIAGLISLIVVYVHLRSERRNKDDELYGRAFKAVMDWTEMPFRKLRARDDTFEQQRELRNRFHELQEEIQFHRGWIGFRSNKLGTRYENFVTSVKALVGTHLQKVETNPDYSKEDLKADMDKAQLKVDQEIKKFRNSVQHRRSWYGWLWEYFAGTKNSNEK